MSQAGIQDALDFLPVARLLAAYPVVYFQVDSRKFNAAFVTNLLSTLPSLTEQNLARVFMQIVTCAEHDGLVLPFARACIFGPNIDFKEHLINMAPRIGKFYITYVVKYF